MRKYEFVNYDTVIEKDIISKSNKKYKTFVALLNNYIKVIVIYLGDGYDVEILNNERKYYENGTEKKIDIRCIIRDAIEFYENDYKDITALTDFYNWDGKII